MSEKELKPCPFCSTSFILQDFSKTVFLTREEAERALNSSDKSNS